MSDFLVIELSGDGTAIVRAGLASKSGQWLGEVSPAKLSEAAADQVVAILPGTGISCWRLALPDMPAAKQLKILPGLMEDRLANAVGDRHYAILQRRAGDDAIVAVVDAALMEAALATLRAAGLDPAAIVPDFGLIDSAETAIVLTGPDGLVRARLADGTGFTLEAELAATVLGDASDAARQSLDVAGWQSLLAQAGIVDANLRQGRYAGRTDMMAALLWFRRAGILSVMAMAAWAGLVALEARDFEKRADIVQADAEALFRASFPDIRRIANLPAQTRQEIAKLRQQSGGEFLKLSQILFQQIEGMEDVLLEGLRFDNADGDLAATLSFASFADGEAFKRQLTDLGVRISEGGSRQEGNRVITDLVIRSAS